MPLARGPLDFSEEQESLMAKFRNIELVLLFNAKGALFQRGIGIADAEFQPRQEQAALNFLCLKTRRFEESERAKAQTPRFMEPVFLEEDQGLIEVHEPRPDQIVF